MGEKTISKIYLTDWQIRLVKDHMGMDLSYLEFDAEDFAGVKYGIQPSEHSNGKMYFEEWQKQKIMDDLNIKQDFIIVCKALSHTKYMGPTCGV